MKIIKDTYDKLFPFQKEGAEFLYNNRKALLADEMGLGKSPQAIIASQMIGADSILIICPASVKYNWRKECIKWGYSAKDIFVINTKNVFKFKEVKGGIFIVNYDIIFKVGVAKVLACKEYDVLICDEAHYLKNKKTKRTKAVYGNGGYYSKALYAWFLTGTPVLNRPVELYTLLYNVFPERIVKCLDYISFTKRYCQGHQGNWGWNAQGACNIDELSGILDGVMLRRERDILPDLPQCSIHKVYLEKTEEIENLLYLEDEIHRDKEDEDYEVVEEHRASIRRKLGLAKVDSVIDYIKDVLDCEEKIVVFAYHTEVIDKLKEGLKKFGVIVVDGRVNSKKKFDNVQKFVNNKNCRVFIGQIDAAGTGIDGLQEVARYAVFTEISYVPGINLQAIGRINRQGQNHKIIVDFLLLEESLDEDIINKVIGKEEVIQQIVKDKDIKLKFETKEEEIEMSIEERIERLTIAIEKLTEVMEGIPKVSTEKVIKPEVAEEPKKKLPKKNKKVEKPVEKPVAKEPKPEEPKPEKMSYEEELKLISNIIFTKAENRSAVLEEVNKLFTSNYPQYQHVFMVEDAEEQQKVVNLLWDFLKEKGLA